VGVLFFRAMFELSIGNVLVRRTSQRPNRFFPHPLITMVQVQPGQNTAQDRQNEAAVTDWFAIASIARRAWARKRLPRTILPIR
jgi:hypothetical protein